MVQKLDKIWMDGKLMPWDDASIHVLCHSIHYGVGVFEGIRAYKCPDNSAVFRLQEHVDRLFDSAKVVLMNIPYERKRIFDAIIETLQANRLEEGYIRPVAFIGDGAMGVYPAENPIRIFIAVWAWGAYLGDEALTKGIRIKTSTYTRHNVNSMMTKAKVCGNYVNSVLSKKEALSEGYNEALLLDTEGYVAEGSGENIFIVKNGVIKTPPPTAILAGITRDSIMTLAADLGYKVKEQRFTRDELYIADEAFFTGTAAEVTPIREVDRRQIGAGCRGPVTEHLQTEYLKIVKGRNPNYSKWLSPYGI